MTPVATSVSLFVASVIGGVAFACFWYRRKAKKKRKRDPEAEEEKKRENSSTNSFCLVPVPGDVMTSNPYQEIEDGLDRQSITTTYEELKLPDGDKDSTYGSQSDTPPQESPTRGISKLAQANSVEYPNTKARDPNGALPNPEDGAYNSIPLTERIPPKERQRKESGYSENEGPYNAIPLLERKLPGIQGVAKGTPASGNIEDGPYNDMPLKERNPPAKRSEGKKTPDPDIGEDGPYNEMPLRERKPPGESSTSPGVENGSQKSTGSYLLPINKRPFPGRVDSQLAPESAISDSPYNPVPDMVTGPYQGMNSVNPREQPYAKLSPPVDGELCYPSQMQPDNDTSITNTTAATVAQLGEGTVEGASRLGRTPSKDGSDSDYLKPISEREKLEPIEKIPDKKAKSDTKGAEYVTIGAGHYSYINPMRTNSWNCVFLNREDKALEEVSRTRSDPTHDKPAASTSRGETTYLELLPDTDHNSRDSVAA